MIKIQTEISFKEYLKLLFGLAYRKIGMILIVIFDVLMIGWIVLSDLHKSGIPHVKIFQYLTVIVITFIQPLVIYLTIRRNYMSSAILKEPMDIEFQSDILKLKGESFYTELLWNKIFKIVEHTNWFLIYENNLSAVIIPKKNLAKEDIIAIKNFFCSLEGLNLHLKN